MNNAIGSTAVLVGGFTAAVAIVVLFIGLTRDRRDLVRTTPVFAGLSLLSALVAFAAMERALITRDFTVRFVAENGSTQTPALYNFATLWGALEGSILLWTLILVGYLCAVVWRFRKRLGDKLLGWAMLVMFAVTLFFFGIMATSANPFQTFSPPIGFDGPGPNPLLQNNLLMAYHPPFLYLGFVGFTVPFAFAIAALITGRLGEGWLVETRRWTLFAFAFLTMGIMLGAWWSYEVLGWGGYWAWDPVENASLLPWLTGTAYLHSVMVQERRGMLRVWNLSLLCATFSLTILGTFLTRSGVLNSVHNFTESGIGPAFLGFFGVVVAVSVGLIFWRGDRLRSPGRIDSPVSREGAFLVNNLLFACFALVVLLGTVFPLIVEALNDTQITVGAPYFNRMIGPIVIALLFLMGVAPALPWRKASTETLRHRLLIPAWVGAATVVFAVAVGARGLVPLVVFGLGGFVVGASLRQIVLATRRQGWRGLVGRTNGGMIVHIGVVVVVVGVVASSAYVSQGDFTLEENETARLAGHTVTYLGAGSHRDGNAMVHEARIRIDGGPVHAPKLKQFANASQVVGTPSVRSTPIDDVYLSLLSMPSEPGGPITVRVYVEPLVSWIWVGSGLIFVGSVLAAFPGRRRIPTDPVSAPIGDGEQPGRSGPGRDSETGAEADGADGAAGKDRSAPVGAS